MKTNFSTRRWLVPLLILMGWIVLRTAPLRVQAGPARQELISATPAVITLPQVTLNSIQQDFTETPTPTITPLGPVVLEALSEANVRSQPDPASERLGSIRAGDYYPVIGRYYQWLQFQYDPSPSGRGWVFGELVTVTGDLNTVPDLSQQPTPTTDAALAGASQTAAVVTLTPGGELTVASDSSREIAAPIGLGTVNPTTQVQGTVLPTYTYPPDIVALAPTEAPPSPTPETNVLPISVNNGIPPILPIIILGGFGTLGLIISALRRQ